MMTWILIVLLVLFAYLSHKLFIKPIRMKAFYSKIFKANGYKIFELPYSFLAAPFLADWMQNQKAKNDFNYTGKYVYSDSYDLLISNVFNKPELVFFNEKLMKGFLDKDIQMKLPKMNTGFDALQYVGQRSLAFSQKNAWKHKRSLLSKIFNFDFVNSQIPIMIQSAKKTFQRYQQQYWTSNPQKKTQRRMSISLYDMISKFTSSIIMAGFLGMDSMKEQLKDKTIQQEILKLADEGIRLSRDPLVLLFGKNILKYGLRKEDRQFVAFNREINEILKTYIQNYRLKLKEKPQHKKQQSKTIIQLILDDIEKEKQKPSENKGPEISDEDLIDQMKGFVIAGTDTTSNYLTMLILYIYQHKEVLQRLRSQIKKEIKCDQDITYQNMKKITYLDYVMQQGSRMLGASEMGFQRILQEDSSICDIPMIKGTCLNIYFRPMFSNPKNFKEPLSFRPQRWEEASQENKRLLQLISYQFYGGPRSCIGKQLALTQTKVGVITFLRRYKSLVEPGINNRAYAFELTAHLVNSDVILERSEENK